MSDEPSGLPRKKFLPLGEVKVEITEPVPVPVHFADVYTEVRVSSGLVYLSLASLVVDISGDPEARVCVRVRMTVETAANVQAALSEAITRSQTKQTAN